MSDETHDAKVRELTHENRRLRQILATLAKAGLGTGATFEVIEDNDPDAPYFGIVVCRADRDEAAFVKDAETAMNGLTVAVSQLAQVLYQGEARPEAAETLARVTHDEEESIDR